MCNTYLGIDRPYITCLETNETCKFNFKPWSMSKWIKWINPMKNLSNDQ